ncbi:MAG: VTT domain-containing protein [Pseudomonadota bacterium]
MVVFLRRLGRFLSEMDARAITSLSISIILLVFVILMFAFGRQWLSLEQEGALTELMARAADSPLALIGVVSVYALLALTGFPQILLITATVIAFGPQAGASYAWIATMVSATLTFGLGHFLGGGWVRRIGGDRVERTIAFLSRHGVAASGLVRVVPSAPFIVVNAAAGAAHIPLWKYWLGTGVGIIPKIAMVALLGALAPAPEVLSEGIGGVLDFFTNREPRNLALIGIVVGFWIGLLVLVRIIYRRMRRRERAY